MVLLSSGLSLAEFCGAKLACMLSARTRSKSIYIPTNAQPRMGGQSSAPIFFYFNPLDAQLQEAALFPCWYSECALPNRKFREALLGELQPVVCKD